MSQPEALRLGVLPAPEAASERAEALVCDLPGLVGRNVDLWLCETDGFLGAERSTAQIADTASALLRAHQCDAVLCLTDVPLRLGDRPLLSASSPHERVAIISIPAFGLTRLRSRLREAAAHLIGENLGLPASVW